MKLNTIFKGIPALALACVASSAAVAQTSHYAPEKNPFAPAFQHEYRQGAMPTLEAKAKMDAWRKNATMNGGKQIDKTLYFNGYYGEEYLSVFDGVVLQPKVVLVFLGNWGNASRDGAGNTVFSNDPKKIAPYVQNMFKGLGTRGEGWSGVLTQYCDGTSMQPYATSCTSTAEHTSYPNAPVLDSRIVYFPFDVTDNNGHISSATLEEAAYYASQALGNSGTGANRNTQYFIMTPTGTHPDGFNDGAPFCAWHNAILAPKGNDGIIPNSKADFGKNSFKFAIDGAFDAKANPQATDISQMEAIAFTNAPYIPDMGRSCGAGFVNGKSGGLDGVSMVYGHEYAETASDMVPPLGWYNPWNGENADECSWIPPGSPGAAANVAMATGLFTMQATWSNDTKSCALTHTSVAGNPAPRTLGKGATTVRMSPGEQKLLAINVPKGSRGLTVRTSAGNAINVDLAVRKGSAPKWWAYDAAGFNPSSNEIVSLPAAQAKYYVLVTASDNCITSSPQGASICAPVGAQNVTITVSY